jgi:hypothetical protein
VYKTSLSRWERCGRCHQCHVQKPDRQYPPRGAHLTGAQPTHTLYLIPTITQTRNIRSSIGNQPEAASPQFRGEAYDPCEMKLFAASSQVSPHFLTSHKKATDVRTQMCLGLTHAMEMCMYIHPATPTSCTACLTWYAHVYHQFLFLGVISVCSLLRRIDTI